MRARFKRIEIDEQDLVFGKCRHPVTRNGVTVGGGTVIPEIKFTLPPMSIEESNVGEVRAQYDEMIKGVCQRAVDLHQEEILVEFELLPQMTTAPRIGEQITALLKEVLADFLAKKNLRSLLRVTPVDIRETVKPPFRRTGKDLERVLESFRRCAKAGADLLSIESTGGKEITDQAIMEADVRGIIFGAGILGSQDVEFLWGRICEIAGETGTIPAGDTACGIGNTAMVLADMNYVPKVFSAVVRAITVVRSVVAYETGARGRARTAGMRTFF